MLKKKIMRILNASKKVFKERKKEICIGAVGVALLAGVGVSIGYMSNGVSNDNKTSVVDKVVDKDKTDNKDNKKENADEKDNLVSDNGSVEVTPEKNSTDGSNSSSTGNDSASEDKSNSTESGTSNSGTSTESKPSTGNSSSSNSNSGGSSSSGSGSTNNKPSSGGSSSSNNNKPSSGGTSKPESHTHNWVAITEQVHHDEEGHWEDYIVTPAWTEEVPIYEEQYRAICNTCGADITGSEASHVRNHMLNGENGSYRNEPTKVQVGTNKIEHPAVTDKKWIVDKAAWTETVTTGYKCSGCGATK